MDGPRWPTSPTFGIMAFHVLEIRFPRCEAACPSGGKDSPKAVGSQGWGWGSRAEDHSQGERAVSWHFILVFWLHITNDNTSETDICQYSIWKDLHKPFFGVPPIPYLVKAEGVSAEANRSPISRSTGFRCRGSLPSIDQQHRIRWSCCNIVQPQHFVPGPNLRPLITQIID